VTALLSVSPPLMATKLTRVTMWLDLLKRVTVAVSPNVQDRRLPMRSTVADRSRKMTLLICASSSRNRVLITGPRPKTTYIISDAMPPCQRTLSHFSHLSHLSRQSALDGSLETQPASAASGSLGRGATRAFFCFPGGEALVF
jgi:hypothetical protein